MNEKIGLIGTGMMGGALFRALSKVVSAQNIFLFDVFKEKAIDFAKELGGANVCTSAETLTENCDVIFLAVKPQHLEGLITDISSKELEQKLLVSIAAGVKIEKIKLLFEKNSCKPKRIIRLMPNLPATVGQAMIALCADEDASTDDVAFVKNLLSQAGLIEQVPEKLMDCVTGISGSGPAFVFMFIEALADAAVMCGMPRAQAYIYAAQTVKGSAAMLLETGKNPGMLKDAVCSPAGTTIAGVKALEDGAFRATTMNAVINATKRSEELGK